ncbi:MAG TPA: polyhydroxyalkanoic acid system family protein [Bdellovibrionales bacterium]|nr:polyhydroxyalkanoic acid system family protein [Bdellovibrionales bacterium]
MPKLKFDVETQLAPKDTFTKIKEFFSNDRDLRKLDSNYQCQFDEGRMTGTAKGSKFEAAVAVHAATAGSRVQIEINLPLMLTPFKGMVEKTVQEKLNKLIG